MQIERVEVFGVAIPLAGRFRDAYVVKTEQRSLLVRITSTDGYVGIGNIDPAAGYSPYTVEESLAVLNERLAPSALGLDATNPRCVSDRLNGLLPGHLEAKAVVEMACCDLAARSFGMPIPTYLGGIINDKLYFNGWIGILPPDEAATRGAALRDAGFRSAKIKVSESIQADHERVKAVREAVGPDFNLRIDANGSYDADTSIELARLLIPYQLQLFEQPVPAGDIGGMARVRREAGGVPIMADESIVDCASLIRIIKSEAADMVKVKIMKQGGLMNTMRIIAIAEAAGMPCVIGHGFGLGVSTIAETMVAATSTNIIDGLECIGPLNTTDDIISERLDLSGGSLTLPSGPGFAVVLDDAKLQRYCFSRKDHRKRIVAAGTGGR